MPPFHFWKLYMMLVTSGIPITRTNAANPGTRYGRDATQWGGLRLGLGVAACCFAAASLPRVCVVMSSSGSEDRRAGVVTPRPGDRSLSEQVSLAGLVGVLEAVEDLVGRLGLVHQRLQLADEHVVE